MLEPGLVLTLAMVLRVGQGVRHRVNAKCRARSGRSENRSSRARAWCRAWIGCTAKAKANGKVIPARELKTALRGIHHESLHVQKHQTSEDWN